MRRRYIPYIKIGQTVRFRVASILRYVDGKYLVSAGQPRRHSKTGRSSLAIEGTGSGSAELTPHVPWEAATKAAGTDSGN